MKKRTIIWIGLAITIMLVYGLLNPDRFPFPKCPFLSLTGLKCPGCGSQRALHQFLHGDFLASFKLNILFIPALGYVLFGAVSSAFFEEHWQQFSKHWYGRKASLFILVFIFCYWILRNI